MVQCSVLAHMRLDDAVSNVRFREASETAYAAETKAQSGHSLALNRYEPLTRHNFGCKPADKPSRSSIWTIWTL